MSITSKEFLQRRQGAAGLDWQDYAACRDVDPDLFFPLGTVGASLPQIEQAKRVCRMCPVSGPCLRWALDHGDDGVWGGTTEEERRKSRQSRALGAMQRKEFVSLSQQSLHLWLFFRTPSRMRRESRRQQDCS